MTFVEKVTVDDALSIHDDIIRTYGGMEGVRDRGLLEAALAQPYQTFGGSELYPSIEEKAARLTFGLVENHPFADGNKRTATAILIAFLRANGRRFKPRHSELTDNIVSLAAGKMSADDFCEWLKTEGESE